MKIESKPMRDAARGERCTLQIVGTCNGRTDTTVLAHLPDETHGMAMKADDLSACFACSDCHDAVDRRVRTDELEHRRDWYLRRAMVRTWRRLVELGVVTIKGRKP